MKILSADQIRAWDAFTIQNEPISSFDLMERAAATFTHWFSTIYERDRPVFIFCGTGNNGGDGVAIARILHFDFYEVHVFICKISNNETTDFQNNLQILPDILRGQISEGDAFFPEILKNAVVIDAILGSGLSRSVEGFWADFFQYLNKSLTEIVAVDTPSGLFSDRHTEGLAIIKADRTLSFEQPKLAFLLPENGQFVPNFEIRSIGLSHEFLEKMESINNLVTKNFIQKLLKKRGKFDHKGMFGHALLIVGSAGMAGAAVLSSRACIRSGVGLLTVQTPQYNRLILQISVPEAMIIADSDDTIISQVIDYQKFTAVGIGCGIGRDERTAAALHGILQTAKRPLVLDADALNIISENPDWLDLIPKGSILTPHLKEFERLFGKSNNDFDRLECLRERAKFLKIHILLKGAHTIVADTEGSCFFNATGNAGMATAGSGDVLTGIITGLLAQGYAPRDAAILGVYWHGLSGDVAARKLGQPSLIASDIIENLGEAFLEMVKD